MTRPSSALGVQPGDFVMIRYAVGGKCLWHDRLVLALAAGPLWGVGILTPDGDAYTEVLVGGPDVAACVVCAGGAAGGAAVGIGGDPGYRFRAVLLATTVKAAQQTVETELGLPAAAAVEPNVGSRHISAGAGVAATGAAPAAGGGAADGVGGGIGGGGLPALAVAGGAVLGPGESGEQGGTDAVEQAEAVALGE
ncbi:unnamed protein product [Prorocentrum cordatum]|uniref:Uncharacterized protein n=1 Tax=Prorocentrum cordatum TaxID=2364126 RepID=A0ABN9VQD4_9DINO|nr:unnamed protein product [Polarella glacialis]